MCGTVEFHFLHDMVLLAACIGKLDEAELEKVSEAM